MKTIRIPLAGTHNQRSISGEMAIVAGQDQRFINCRFDVVKNPITGKAQLYVEKRPGWGVMSLVAAGSPSTGWLRSDVTQTVISAFGNTNSTIYDGVTNIGAITGQAIFFNETIINGVGYVTIRSSNGDAWYYASDSKGQTAYVGDTHTNTTIDNIASTAGMYVGQLIAGTGIVAGTRIAAIVGPNSITVDTATTATASGVAITKTPLARITDPDFVNTGTTVTNFEFMDGFTFYANSDGYLYQSDINTLAFSVGNKIPVNLSPDPPLAIAKYRESIILCFGNNSMEAFKNGENPTGSVLSSYKEFSKHVGIQDQRSLAVLEDDIYFVSSTREGDIKVNRLRGSGIDRISTPIEERIIGTANALGAKIYVSAFNLGGYSYVSVILTSTGDGNNMLLENDSDFLWEDGSTWILEGGEGVDTTFSAILLYNVQLNIWAEWDTTKMTFMRGLGNSSLNQIAATSRLDTGGKIYLMNPSANGELYTDDGTPYTMTIQTTKIDFGTDNRKVISQIDLIADQAPSGTATLEASDDDYQTWRTLGTFDMTKPKKQITRCGSYTGGRAYRLKHSDDAPFRGQALDITYDVVSKQ